MGFCAIRPPVNCDTGGDTVIGFVTVRFCGRPVAFVYDCDAVTAGALTVVAVRVCLFGALIVLTVFCGVPPVLRIDPTLDPRELVERDALEFDLLDEPPLEPPPPEPPPLELEPLDEPPAPADPVPERRANLSAPQQKF